MPYVREAIDVENPAIAKLGRPKHQKLLDDDDQPSRRCSFGFLKAGWFWAVVIVVTVICVAAPIGVRTTKRLNDPVTDTPNYKFNGTGLNTTIPDAFDASWGLNPNETTTCDMVAADIPSVPVPKGQPAAALKLQGNKLVTAAGGKEVQIHGINWFGFNNGKTMVDGLDGENTISHTWQSGDFATIVYQLRLLGFNAVRLPFLFNDLLARKPQDYSKPCPEQPPTAQELAARTTNPALPTPPNAPIPFTFVAPEGSEAGRCNAYVPNTGNVLSRYLWVVQYFVANGFYVVMDYHPHGIDLEPGVLETEQNFASAWLRVWKALTCLPNYEKDIKGRVLLDVLNEPDGVDITWSGTDGRLPLTGYLLTVMDAIDKHSPNQAVYIVQGGGQDKLGTAWGDGFATNASLVKERNISDATPFFKALCSKPYKGRVVLGPHLYSGSISKNNDVGEKQWQKYADSWGYLMKAGFCGQKFPVIIGEVGTNFSAPIDTEYFTDMAKFMQKEPPADKYASSKFNNWIWWAYNANSGDTGGLVDETWQNLDWTKLGWMQDNLGLTPWYKQ
uniref:Glycoside hydrolase family 5 domain-containing protein n=1 Tax=Tetradesmus obliquus TaxID=3088 RepID=A0A383W3T8_TETOB|eukprot:jgi/Sobl393_1/2582/SZX72327.1